MFIILNYKTFILS